MSNETTNEHYNLSVSKIMFVNDFYLNYQSEEIKHAIIQYAEWYALEYRSKILDNCWTDDYGQTLISDTELLKIEFPTHD